MATKNNKLTYDIDELKSAYNAYLSDDSDFIAEKNKYEKISANINAIDAEISTLNADITYLESSIAKANAPKDILKAISDYSSNVATVKAMFDNYNLYSELKTKAQSHTLTSEELAHLSAFKENHEKFVEDYSDMVKRLSQEFSTLAMDELIKKINDRIEELKLLNTQKGNLSSLQQQKAELENTRKSLVSRQSKLDSVITSQTANSVENFTEFLQSEGLPTVHAEEIFEYLNDHSKALKMNKNSFKIRKRHPKRDAIIKKGLIPASVVGAGIGSTIGLIASSGLVGGSTILGFIPVSGTPGLTALATTMTGGMIGLVATPIIIKTKNELVKAYYKARYKSAKTNLKDYENGTTLENLHITDLMEKVENTKHKILKLSTGNWFTKMFKFVPKHVLNTINRNRIHHIEKYTKDLMSIYANTLNVDEEDIRLNNIYNLLNQVEDFVAKDVAESKLHAMLTCKETRKHSHKATIENIDIFANLKIYLDTVGLATNKSEKHSQEKQAKKTIKNLKQKTTTATQILNGERLIPQMIAMNYSQTKEVKTIVAVQEETIAPVEATNADKEQNNSSKTNQFQPVERKIVSQLVDYNSNKAVLKLDNGKIVELDCNYGIQGDIISLRNEKNKIVLTYEDGSIVEVAKDKKFAREIETARRVMYTKITDDQEFVQTLKTVYDTRTINTLASKLQVWVNNPTSRLALSGKSKELYKDIMETINRENEVEVSM